ncbi:MAG: Calx-beta domain-containing protein [Stenotrophobium sp.]
MNQAHRITRLFAFIAVLASAILANDAMAAVTPANQARIAGNYGKLPIAFEANAGQTDAQVKFLARGSGYALFLTPGEAVMSLRKSQGKTAAKGLPGKTTAKQKVETAVVRTRLLGANPKATVAGEELLPGKSNYLIGNDAAKWHTSVDQYARVRYGSVYPGVDLVYYGNQQQLEYDFVVAPGADPGNIRLAYQGARKLAISSSGDLVIKTKTGELIQRKPLVYQDIDGQRKPVDGRFKLIHSRQGTQIAFALAQYDHARALTIDPVLAYSTYLGSGGDQANGIAVDSAGNAYVAGYTSSTFFPTANPLQPANAGGTDAFVAKLNAAGSALVYSTYLGGSGDNQANAIAVDSTGNAYVAGVTLAYDFPTANPLQPANAGGADAFVAKLNAAGSALVYSTYLGGSETSSSGNDQANGIAVDSAGNAYVAGQTSSTNFPTANPLQAVNLGGTEAFVAKLVPALTAVQFGQANYSAGENGGTATIAVLRTGSTENAVSVHYASSDGSGINGTHYTATSGTLSWGVGDNSTKFFTVPVKDDGIVDGDHTVNLALSAPTGEATLGVPNTAVLTVTNTDTPPPPTPPAPPPPPPPVPKPGALQFSSSTYVTGEKSGSVTVTVDRANGSDGAVTVHYATSDGTGVAGTHYTSTSGVLNWGAGDLSAKTFSVPVLDDGKIDGDHSVNLTLSVPTGGASLTAPSTAVLDIADADAQNGVIQFGLASYLTTERGGAATITVIRSGSGSGAVTVNYATADGTGVAGTNYTAASGTLNWANGDTSVKTFSVPVLDDGVVNGDHTVNLLLSAPGGGAALASPANAVLTMSEADVATTLSFGTASFQASEKAGTATITVIRLGGNASAVSVSYATSDGTGVAKTNYTAASGTLNWAAGDNSAKTFTVPVLDDGNVNGDHTINLTLSSPVGGATLASPSTAVLTVTEADLVVIESKGGGALDWHLLALMLVMLGLRLQRSRIKAAVRQ